MNLAPFMASPIPPRPGPAEAHRENHNEADLPEG